MVLRVGLQRQVEALHGAAVVAHVLVEDAEVHHAGHVDRRDHQRALVELARLFVFTAQVDVERQAEQRAPVLGVHGEDLVVEANRRFRFVLEFFDDRVEVALLDGGQLVAVVGERRAERLEVPLGLEDRQPRGELRRVRVLHGQGRDRVVVASQAHQRTGDAARDGGVAALLLEQRQGLVVAAQRPEHEPALQAHGHRALQPVAQALDLAQRPEHVPLERLDRLVVDRTLDQGQRVDLGSWGWGAWTVSSVIRILVRASRLCGPVGVESGTGLRNALRTPYQAGKARSRGGKVQGGVGADGPEIA